MMLAIGLVGIVAGAFVYAGALHLLMEKRYGHRDYRPDMQQAARVLSVIRWIALALVIVGAWVLFMEGKWEIATYVFVGWFVISLLVQITAKTLRKWGTEA
jgi:D-alanyl-lipoteichoic acid acyltransferase DltB (MBOAT superfamily)